jgi:sugar diacid utilization regulator
MEFSFSVNASFKSATDEPVYYLDGLLKGFSVDEKIIAYHLNARSWKTNDDFRMYHIASPGGESLTISQVRFCLFRIRQLAKSAIVFEYENTVNIIIRKAEEDRRGFPEEEIKAFLSKLGLRCGRSLVFHLFSDLKYYYIQCKTAVYEGGRLGKPDIILRYEDCYLSHVMRILEQGTSLKSICHPGILLLHEHDMAGDSEYIKCLQTFIYTGCNMAQTAKILYVHRNTLEYRIEKILEILNMDIAGLGESERMHLWFSCRICGFL